MKSFFGGKIGTATPLAGEATRGGEPCDTSPLQINESHEVESSCYDVSDHLSLDMSVHRLSSADLLTDHGNDSPKKANHVVPLNRARGSRVLMTPMPAKT
jgi:hypothetical protein